MTPEERKKKYQRDKDKAMGQSATQPAVSSSPTATPTASSYTPDPYAAGMGNSAFSKQKDSFDELAGSRQTAPDLPFFAQPFAAAAKGITSVGANLAKGAFDAVTGVAGAAYNIPGAIQGVFTGDKTAGEEFMKQGTKTVTGLAQAYGAPASGLLAAAKETSIGYEPVKALEGAVQYGQGVVKNVAKKGTLETAKMLGADITPEVESRFDAMWEEKAAPLISAASTFIGGKAVRSGLKGNKGLSAAANVVDFMDNGAINAIKWGVVKPLNKMGGGAVRTLLDTVGLDINTLAKGAKGGITGALKNPVGQEGFAGLVKNFTQGVYDIRDNSVMSGLNDWIEKTPQMKNIFSYAEKATKKANPAEAAAKSKQWMDDQAREAIKKQYGMDAINYGDIDQSLKNTAYSQMFDTDFTEKTRPATDTVVRTFKDFVSTTYKNATDTITATKEVWSNFEKGKQSIYDSVGTGVRALRAKVEPLVDTVTDYLEGVDNLPKNISSFMKGMAKNISSNGTIDYLISSRKQLDTMIADPKNSTYAHALIQLKDAVDTSLDSTLKDVDPGMKTRLDEYQGMANVATTPLRDEFYSDLQNSVHSEEGLSAFMQKYKNKVDPSVLSGFLRHIPEEAQVFFVTLKDEIQGVLQEVMDTQSTREDYINARKNEMDDGMEDTTNVPVYETDNVWSNLGRKAKDLGAAAKTMAYKAGLKDTATLRLKAAKGDLNAREVLKDEIGFIHKDQMDIIHMAEQPDINIMKDMVDFMQENPDLAGALATRPLMQRPEKFLAAKIFNGVANFQKILTGEGGLGEQLAKKFENVKKIVIDTPPVFTDLAKSIENKFGIKVTKEGFIDPNSIPDSSLILTKVIDDVDDTGARTKRSVEVDNAPVIKTLEQLLQHAKKIEDKGSMTIEEFNGRFDSFEDQIADGYVDSIESNTATHRKIRSVMEYAQSQMKMRPEYAKGSANVQDWLDTKKEYAQLSDVNRLLARKLLPGGKAERSRISNIEKFSPAEKVEKMEKLIEMMDTQRGAYGSKTTYMLGELNRVLYEKGIEKDPTAYNKIHDFLGLDIEPIYDYKYKIHGQQGQGTKINDGGSGIKIQKPKLFETLVNLVIPGFDPVKSRNDLHGYVTTRAAVVNGTVEKVRQKMEQDAQPQQERTQTGNTRMNDTYMPDEETVQGQGFTMSNAEPSYTNSNKRPKNEEY